MYPCVPLAIKTITIVFFKILTVFRFRAIRSSSLTLNEIMIALIAKRTQGICTQFFLDRLEQSIIVKVLVTSNCLLVQTIPSMRRKRSCNVDL